MTGPGNPVQVLQFVMLAQGHGQEVLHRIIDPWHEKSQIFHQKCRKGSAFHPRFRQAGIAGTGLQSMPGLARLKRNMTGLKYLMFNNKSGSPIHLPFSPPDR
ncbi:MAG: hypothetical protein NT112_04740 [Methanoregula sp.]|nr:hypothetical protein [Methanoregula sp.]